MKKIFLTSGLVMCMACPAFATVDLDASGNASGYTNECVEPVLGVYEAPADNPVQLEALWNAKNYEITFAKGSIAGHDATYITGTTNPIQNLTFESTNITLLNSYSANGYHFTGWSSPANLSTGATTTTAYNGTADSSNANANYSSPVLATYGYASADPNRTVELTAQWAPNTYSVTYNPGSHATTNSNYVDPVAATYDTSYTIKTLAGAGFAAAPGYTFTGWSDATNSAEYAADATGAITPSAIANWTYLDDITLTAQYSANAYQITYAGGTAGSRPVTETAMSATPVHYDDTNVALATNTYAIAGYHFTGWSGDHDASNGATTTTPYGATDTIAQYKVVGDLALTAQWAANTTTVSYSCVMDDTMANNASVYTGIAPTTNTSATYDASFAFAANTTGANACARDGWTFDGWTCTSGGNTLTIADVYGSNAANGTSTVLPANSAATWLYTGADNGSISCVAHYTANRIYVNWYTDSVANNGTKMDVDTASESCVYDGNLVVPTAPTKNGYTFSGWTVRSTSNEAPAQEAPAQGE